MHVQSLVVSSLDRSIFGAQKLLKSWRFVQLTAAYVHWCVGNAYGFLVDLEDSMRHSTDRAQRWMLAYIAFSPKLFAVFLANELPVRSLNDTFCSTTVTSHVGSVRR